MYLRVSFLRDVCRRIDPRLGYLCRFAVAILVPVAGFFHIVWMTSQATSFIPEPEHGSGIVIRTEVTEVWLSRPLFELATMTSFDRIVENLPALTGQRDLAPAWYAMTYRGHQFDGGYAVMTQVRRLCEAVDHPDELRLVVDSVVDAANAEPPHGQARVRIRIIPDHVSCDTPLALVERMLRPAHQSTKRFR